MMEDDVVEGMVIVDVDVFLQVFGVVDLCIGIVWCVFLDVGLLLLILFDVIMFVYVVLGGVYGYLFFGDGC